MKTLAILVCCAFWSTLSQGAPSEPTQEFLRILDFDSSGGRVSEIKGDLEFPIVLNEQPKTFESQPKITTVTTVWEDAAWKEFSATRGFSYSSPPAIIEDVASISKLFSSDKKELCRTFDLPRLGRLDLVASLDSSEGGKSTVTITVIQRTLFFLNPTK